MAEFEQVIAAVVATGRRKTAAKMWRVRQWRDGNRTCAYCHVEMVRPRKDTIPEPRTATVDHKEPLILGGDDAPWNWCMCCWLCNNRKGAMTEAEFRSLLACEAA